MSAGTRTGAPSHEGGVLHARLPAGPFDARAAHDLTRVADAARSEDGVRVVVLEGAGEDFCPGLAAGFEPLTSGLDPAAAIAGLTMPVVAVLHGAVASVGLEIALAADLRIADEAVLSLPDLAAGRLPCWGATQRLTRLGGPSLATRMLLGGEAISAPVACAAGLVDTVVAPGELSRTAARLTAHLAALAPLALAYAKEAIRAGAQLPMVDGLRLEADLNVLLQASADRKEGLDAFFAGRDPTFGGG
jgi:enoyl-CoA hydratase/carnithine racemase